MVLLQALVVVLHSIMESLLLVMVLKTELNISSLRTHGDLIGELMDTSNSEFLMVQVSVVSIPNHPFHPLIE